EYMSLIQYQLQPYFPKFAAAVSRQSPVEREQGRVAVVEFRDDGTSSTTSFHSSAELQSYLRKSLLQSPAGDAPRRRLFILEDLPCNHILALGSRLRIHPSFFAGHWDDPANPTFNHRNPFVRFSKNQFRLRYATSARVEVDNPINPNTNVYAFNSNVCRYLHVYNPKGILYDEARSHHTLSFWSSLAREDGSWDAVLLVDPALGENVRYPPSMQVVRLPRELKDENAMPKRFLFPEIDTLGELPDNCTEWSHISVQPKYYSMFDDAIGHFSGKDGTMRCDSAFDTTAFARKLVIAHLVAFIRRRYLNLLTVQKNQHALRHNYLSDFTKSCFSTWNDNYYDFIVGTCAAMKEFSREIDDNLVALGLDSRESARQWEVDGWKSVRETTRTVSKLADSFATSYLQYISIQEARVSNSNAHSLSRITVLTMLFIPLSTVASIFSMGGDFLPGERKAWVFWVAAIPVIFVLAYLY
ncbi:hypothetical protein BDV96DRAFT_452151, partial [Lophiotrema nucula]